MTTQTYTAVIDHTSDAGFRAWGAALSANLAAAGLVQTADSGQINWSTVTRPSTSTAGGYEIWRFADSSLYLKIEYGTGSGANTPNGWITVGTGSNGSGTITGQSSTRSTWMVGNAAAASTSTTYTTYICRTANVIGVVFGANANGGIYPMGYFVVGKTVDGNGDADSTGFGVLRSSGSGLNNPSLQTVRTAATAATFNDTTNCILFAGNPSSSLDGADVQAYLMWLNAPRMTPFAWACGYVIAEITELNTFSVALVASASHTYLALGQLSSSAQLNGQSGTTYSIAMIYE